MIQKYLPSRLLKILLQILSKQFQPHKIHSKNNKGDKVEIIAELTIGKGFLHETYKSFVIYKKDTNLIHVTNMEGPLKHLENKWFFKAIGNISEIEFHVDFELKNKALNIIMSKSFDIGLMKIADVFEKRAIELFQRT